MLSSKLSALELAQAIGIDLSPTPYATLDTNSVERMARFVSSRPAIFNANPAEWQDNKFWNADGSAVERAQFIALGNSINFRFWKLENGELSPSKGSLAGESFRGSMYMWRSLRRALERSGKAILKATFLARLSESDFDSLFTDDTGGNPLAVAREERIANIRDFGRELVESWQGEFRNVLKAAGGSLTEFARLSKRFRAFDDPLCKLTMVNAIMQSGSGLIRFDYAPLPGIDYHLLKQVIRQGLVRVDEHIARKLEQRMVLDPAEALGIRRMALLAFIELSTRTGVGGDVLDNVWWFNKSKCLDRVPVCAEPLREHECPFLEVCERKVSMGLPLEETRYY